jgi:hypothetical protein
MRPTPTRATTTAGLIAMLAIVTPLAIDAAAQRGAPPLTSPEVGADRRVTLRLYAPNAKSVSAPTTASGA